jgi:hypothetical protein
MPSKELNPLKHLTRAGKALLLPQDGRVSGRDMEGGYNNMPPLNPGIFNPALLSTLQELRDTSIRAERLKRARVGDKRHDALILGRAATAFGEGELPLEQFYEILHDTDLLFSPDDGAPIEDLLEVYSTLEYLESQHPGFLETGLYVAVTGKRILDHLRRQGKGLGAIIDTVILDGGQEHSLVLLNELAAPVRRLGTRVLTS